MKGIYRLANISLAVALIGTVASYPVRHTFFWGLVYAGCSAALIGGLADWFALTALFRHPLGLRIPHTAIIERNKDTLIQNIADLVQNEMLPLKVVQRNIERFTFIERILNYYQTDNGKKYISKLLLHTVKELSNSVNVRELSNITSKRVKRQLKKIDACRSLTMTLDWVRINAYDEYVIDHLLDTVLVVVKKDSAREWLEKLISSTAEEYKEGGFLRKFGINLSVQLDILNYKEAAEKIQSKVISVLKEIREDNDHECRFRIKNKIYESFIESLESDEFMQESIRKWKDDLINRLPVDLWIEKAFVKAEKKLMKDLNNASSLTIKVLKGFVDEQIVLLSTDEARKQKIDQWIKRKIAKFVEEEIHPRLANIVKDNLTGLDNDTVVAMVEKRVGKDLQYIRINGALVGGTVGILLYLIELFATRVVM